MTEPLKNGVTVIGVTLPDDVRPLLLKRSEKGKQYLADIVVELVQKGLEHERLCGKRPAHIRIKR